MRKNDSQKAVSRPEVSVCEECPSSSPSSAAPCRLRLGERSDLLSPRRRGDADVRNEPGHRLLQEKTINLVGKSVTRRNEQFKKSRIKIRTKEDILPELPEEERG